MRSAATSEFDEDFGQNEQMGINAGDSDHDMDADNFANDLDNGRYNKKVCTISLLIMTIQTFIVMVIN